MRDQTIQLYRRDVIHLKLHTRTCRCPLFRVKVDVALGKTEANKVIPTLHVSGAVPPLYWRWIAVSFFLCVACLPQ